MTILSCPEEWNGPNEGEDVGDESEIGECGRQERSNYGRWQRDGLETLCGVLAARRARAVAHAARATRARRFLLPRPSHLHALTRNTKDAFLHSTSTTTKSSQLFNAALATATAFYPTIYFWRKPEVNSLTNEVIFSSSSCKGADGVMGQRCEQDEGHVRCLPWAWFPC